MSIDSKLVDDESFWILSKMAASSGLELICDWNSLISGLFSASGMVSSAATALMADRFSSSCFSNSCFTEFAFTLVVHVARNGSTSRSNLCSTALGQG